MNEEGILESFVLTIVVFDHVYRLQLILPATKQEAPSQLRVFPLQTLAYLVNLGPLVQWEVVNYDA